MPNKDQLMAVGQTCSEYDCSQENSQRSCESCNHWAGEQSMCDLDIFVEQLTSLDQT